MEICQYWRAIKTSCAECVWHQNSAKKYHLAIRKNSSTWRLIPQPRIKMINLTEKANVICFFAKRFVWFFLPMLIAVTIFVGLSFESLYQPFQ
jgi:hypothetical protein